MSERWKPENGEQYWIIAFSEVVQSEWRADCADLSRWRMGNCFKTKEEAVAALEKITALLLSSHKQTEDCNQLPKLTAEIFDHPDCPAWAKYAAVDKNGAARFHAEEPIVPTTFDGEWWCSEGNDSFIAGKFDAHDWKNSLIERPTKLPAWVEIGGYVYDDRNGYGKIVSGSVKSCYIEFDGGAGDFVPEAFAELKQAHLRPYNADEIPDLPFEVSERNSNFRTTIVSCQGDKVWLAGATTAISTEELLREFTIKGKICGVFEHLENGEWVE